MTEPGDNGTVFHRDIHDQQERLKELACINRTTQILKERKPLEETLMHLVLELPGAWQYPDYAVVRIRYRSMSFESPGFTETPWKLYQEFNAIEGKGSVEVFYTREFLAEHEGPFLKEERDLLKNFAGLITGYINSLSVAGSGSVPGGSPDDKEDIKTLSSRQLLQKFLDRHNAERDVFHDLMPFMVREILLVASLYDAYSIEGEGRFSDHMLGEYYQMSLTTLPRITGVSGEDEAFSRLGIRHYDMIIIMVGVDKTNPMSLCRKIKENNTPISPHSCFSITPAIFPSWRNRKPSVCRLITILSGQANRRSSLQWQNCLKTR